jgi:anti-sigma B factor antagonist
MPRDLDRAGELPQARERGANRTCPSTRPPSAARWGGDTTGGDRPALEYDDAMNVVKRQVGGVVIFDLHGRMVIGEGDRALRQAITGLADSGKAKVLLNLADVSYVDSSVLSEIVRAYTTVTRDGGKLKLLGLPPKIQDLLSMTRLLTVFETYQSEDEAVRSF